MEEKTYYVRVVFAINALVSVEAATEELAIEAAKKKLDLGKIPSVNEITKVINGCSCVQGPITDIYVEDDEDHGFDPPSITGAPEQKGVDRG